jgi:hypothetical protein
MVLIDEWGTFYRSMEDAEPVIRRAPPPPPTLNSPKTLGAVRVIAEHGPWIEIETLPLASVFDAGYCQGPARIPGIGGAQVRLFIKRESLVHQVLTTEHETRFDDGSVLRLKPGVLLLPTETPGVHGFNLPKLSGVVAIPPAKVGPSFDVPQAVFDEPKDVGIYAPPPGKRVEVHRLRPRMHVAASRLESPDRLQITHDCLQAELVVPAPVELQNMAGVLGLGADGPDGRVAAGTELVWRGGRRAGQTVHPMPFDRMGEPDGGRSCVQIASDWHPSKLDERGQLVPTAFVELCADPAAVKAPKSKGEKPKTRR